MLAVALATALSVAVAASMATLERSLRHTLGEMVGLLDVRLSHRYGQRVEAALLEQVRSWPEVNVAVGRFDTGLSLVNPRNGQKSTAMGEGVDPKLDQQLHPRRYTAGRGVERRGETVIDQKVREQLDAKLGDKLDLIRFGEPVKLTVVGIIERPPLEVLQRPLAVLTLEQAQELAGLPNLLDEVELTLKPNHTAEELQEKYGGAIPKTVMFQTPAAATAGVNRGIHGVKLLVGVVLTLVFLSAGFIILTSLTTAVTERLRELGILRCIGTGRGQIAAAQILTGLILAGLGALLGTPIGLALAYLLYRRHQEELLAGFSPGVWGVTLAVAAAVASGLAGAISPAVAAARVRPMQALAVRSRKPSRRSIVLCLLLGLAFISVHPLIALFVHDSHAFFYATMVLGLPLMFAGYFLLAVPVLVALGHALAPLLARAMGLPHTLLSQSVLSTPFRHGFTGGALMISLAMLVSIWTLGRSVMGSWLHNLRMPEAFVQSFYPFTAEQEARIDALPEVGLTCGTALFEVQVDSVSFGLKGVSPTKTYFVSFEPDGFFAMTDLTWYEGTVEEASRRLNEGRALLVSHEYTAAHGLHRGDRLTITTVSDGKVDFEIVGVIGSPGLDVAVQTFGISNAYSERAISSVFGSRGDAARYFGVKEPNLILATIAPDVGDERFVKAVKAVVPTAAAGTSRMVTRRVDEASESFMTIASTVAIASLLIACLGVGNLILANIASRRFEYGVLRAMGADRWMLGRIIAAETIVIGLTGCIVGSALGYQLAKVGQGVHHRLVGLVYDIRLPVDVTSLGWLAVLLAALLAALPAIVKLVREPTRALLAAEQGG